MPHPLRSPPADATGLPVRSSAARRFARFATRCPSLTAELVWACTRFNLIRLRTRRDLSLRERALWMQHHARRILEVFRAELDVRGRPPERGLLVCNHLSYVDIPVLVAIAPALFVSKSEVQQWPLFGTCATMGGTLYVDRQRRQDVARLNREILKRLDDGHRVILFPEGTSSDGHRVLPFRSSLLEAASQTEHPITAVGLQYQLPEGNPSQDVCWWGDMTLTGHLPRLLSRPSLRAVVAFERYCGERADRKTLAHNLRNLVDVLRSASQNEPRAP